MRLRAVLALASVLALLAALAACAPADPAASSAPADPAASSVPAGSAAGSSGVPASPTGSAAASGSTTTSAAAPTSAASPTSAAPVTMGPAVPADTTVAPAVDRDRMPTVTGAFGDKPTINVPSTPPPPTLQRVVLSSGDGPTTVAGDWLEVNYLGQVWGGAVFDNSYDQGATFTVQVGGPQRMVVAGWDVGLRGVPGGSRVLLTFPPQDGYGAAGKPPDISGTDTLMFVVDIVRVIGADAGGDADAVPQSTPAGLPAVEGALGGIPSVHVPESLPEPTETRIEVLASGTGAPAQPGAVLVQYVTTAWDGSRTESSWPDDDDPAAGTGPRAFPLVEGSPFAPLIGVPIGSRVLMTMPADPDRGLPPLAWVIDLVAQQTVMPSTGEAPAGSTPTGSAPTGSAPTGSTPTGS